MKQQTIIGRAGVFLLVLVSLGLTAPVFAVETDIKQASPKVLPGAILHEISPQDCRELLLEQGFLGVEIDGDGDIVVPMQTYKVLLIVGSSKGKFVQFRFAVSGSNASLETMNTWNQKMRFSRAYLEEDQTAVLESEQDLAGGVTRERLHDFIKTYYRSLETFLQEIS